MPKPLRTDTQKRERLSSQDRFAWPLARVGILGGGQLARMMTKKAKKLGCWVSVLDPDASAPAGQVAAEQVVGSFDDIEALRTLAARCDVVTFDIEHVDASLLLTLEAEGHRFFPSPSLLALVQDKLEQKQVFLAHGLPTSRFAALPADTPAGLRAFGFPLVQKARRGGYDGRGVAVIRGEEQLSRALSGATYAEELVDIEKELAVIVARSVSGEVRSFPLVEMVFDPRSHQLDTLLAPAAVPYEVFDAALALAKKTVEAFGAVGVVGVEMFLTKTGELLLNEIAPRPHNSGHYTLEACVTCQFEQHIRAILDLPLGRTDQLQPAAMINLVGESGPRGSAEVVGLRAALAIPGASVHIYGKSESWPMRKMGHVTVLAPTLDEASARVAAVRKVLRISGGE